MCIGRYAFSLLCFMKHFQLVKALSDQIQENNRTIILANLRDDLLWVRQWDW